MRFVFVFISISFSSFCVDIIKAFRVWFSAVKVSIVACNFKSSVVFESELDAVRSVMLFAGDV